ncbi:MAG: SufD family Fe-S cluster assembly protein [Pseudomonadota bacterium]
MTAPADRKEVTEDLLAIYSVDPAGLWLSEARSFARARLLEMGAPHRRDEYWKFTNPIALIDPLEAPEHSETDTEVAPKIPVDAPLKLVFVDGLFDAKRSDPMFLEGVQIDLLSKAAMTDIHWAKDIYGVLEKAGQDPVLRPLAALNTACATEGILLHVMGHVTRPIYIQHIQSIARDGLAHHIVKVDAGASATIIEDLPSSGRSNIVFEADIADTGSLNILRLQAPNHDVVRFAGGFARLGSESMFKCLTLSVNGRFTRNEAVIEFTGDDASAHIAGATSGEGGDFHHDDTVFITHDAVNCESRQVFKKVLRNNAVGVFQGKILVKPNAQKTDGYQISQGLLLDDDSQFLAKPELEIYADDVACSHGSTVGAIDPKAVFYLTSRGVPKRKAVDMLVLAFLAEAIDELDDLNLADMTREKLAEWMGREAL